MIASTIADVGGDDKHEAGLMRISGLARRISQPDLTSARGRPFAQAGSGSVPSWRTDCGASKLIPGLPLGGIDTIWSSELSLHGELQFASAPQAECLVDDGAAVQLGVSGDIGIDAGQ